MTMPTAPATRGVRPGLSVWDTISVIIGIVVGVAIFRVPPLVFSNVGKPWEAIAAWLLGGGLCLVGAACYAELATTYPRSGGDYVYLTRAFGPATGFLFGWAQLAAILTGSIGALAYVFADYAVTVFGQTVPPVAYALGAVVLLTAVNLCGINFGKRTQNALTIAKIAGLIGILVAGLFFVAPAGGAAQLPPSGPRNLGFAMVLILFAYGGWNDAVFVASEVRNQQRSIPVALLAGLGTVILLYALVNVAYVRALGFGGICASRAPAADVLGLAFGHRGSTVMSMLVMISALGAANGTILTGSRVTAALGADHRAVSWLGSWNTRRAAPTRALLAQAAITSGWILLVGTQLGRGAIDDCLQLAGWSAMAWEKYDGGFGTLVAGTAPVFWFFFLLTSVALLILRRKDPDRPRPFAVPLYPWTPLVFYVTCLAMLYSSTKYAGPLSLVGFLPLLLGVVLYRLGRRPAA